MEVRKSIWEDKDKVTMTSKRMSAIRSKNTKIELAVRKKLWDAGMRYRIHYHLPGKPDIVFTKKKIAIFLDGDFWHGNNWNSVKSKLKTEDWIRKIEMNIERDKRTNEELRALGWDVLRFWESEINADLDGVIKIIEQLVSKAVHPNKQNDYILMQSNLKSNESSL